jgi:hypothetical protein
MQVSEGQEAEVRSLMTPMLSTIAGVLADVQYDLVAAPRKMKGVGEVLYAVLTSTLRAR